MPPVSPLISLHRAHAMYGDYKSRVIVVSMAFVLKKRRRYKRDWLSNHYWPLGVFYVATENSSTLRPHSEKSTNVR